MMPKHTGRWQRWWWLPVVMFCLASRSASAQTNLPGWVDPSFEAVPAPIGQINAVVRTSDGKFLVGGTANPADPVLQAGIARLHTNGTLDTTFSVGTGVDFGVWSIALQTNGQILIAGDFTTFNGISHPQIARLNADGSLDSSFNAAADAMVWSIALQPDGRILIGGEFANVNGVLRARVARLEANGTLDATFDPGAGPNGTVRTLLPQGDGRVIIAGGFTMVGEAFRGHIARLESTGALDVAFANDDGANDWISAVTTLRSGQLLVSGFFTSFDGTLRNRVARLNPDGTLDPAFEVGAGPNDGVVAAVEQSDGKVVVAGGFNAIGDRVQGRISRLLPSGEIDRTFEADPGADGWVEALSLQEDGKIVLAGTFSHVNGTPRDRIARIFGGDPTPYAPVITSFPTGATVREGVDVAFAARARAFPEPTYQWRFNGVELAGATTDRLVLRNVRTTNAGIYSLIVSNTIGSATNSVTLTVTPAPVHPGALDITFYTGLGPTNLGKSLALQDTRVLMGGAFHGSNGLEAVARRFNADGSQDATFQPTPLGFGTVEALTPSTGGAVIVGGTAFPSVRRILNNGLIDSSYPAGTNPVEWLYGLSSLAAGQVLGGGRSASGGVSFRRFLSNGSVDPAFAALPPSFGIIFAVSGQPGAGGLVAAGEFTSIGGLMRNRLARFNANGTIDPSFNTGSGPNSIVHTVVVEPNGGMLIGGAFTRVNGITRNRVARLLPSGALDMSFDPGPGPDNNVFALALHVDGKILIGGTFSGVNDVTRRSVARLNRDGSLDVDFDTSDGPDGPVRDLVPVSTNVIITGGFQEVGGVPRPAIARLHAGIAPLAAPVIVSQPQGGAVLAGADVTIFVVARAQPAASYTWQLNGTNVPGANTWVLHLRNVTTRDAGIYRVIVSNNQGAVTSAEAELRVLPAPRTPGAPDIDFFAGSGPNDKVDAIVIDPDGRTIIVGAFTEVNGVARGRIARLHETGEVDQGFDPGAGANGPVRALALQPDGKLLVGGGFSAIDTVQRNRIARLHADGSVDRSFDAGAGPERDVFAIAPTPDGQILIGGYFTNVAGLVSPGIARLNSDGSVDASFVSPFGLDSFTFDIAFQSNGKPIIGGLLRAASIAPTGLAWKTARLENDGRVDATFSNSVAVSGSVNSLAVLNDDRVFAGGSFIARQVGERNRIIRFDTNGAPDPTFTPLFGASNVVNAVALQSDGKGLIGGLFEGVDQFPFKRIARLNLDGRVDASFNPGRGVESGTMFLDEYGELVDLTSVNAIAVAPSGHVMIGGDFTEVNGVTRPYIARIYGRAPSMEVTLRQLNGPVIELSWELGTLEHAVDPAGPWREVANATSPMQVTPGTGQRFYRLRID